jgi:micrococcal nuclease
VTTYRVPATVLRVVDGDTVEVLLDLGWRVHLREVIRLYGIDTPETRGPKVSPEGKKAAGFTQSWIKEATSLEVESLSFDSRLDKFGRTLARIYRNGEAESLNGALIRSGHATVYPASNDDA